MGENKINSLKFKAAVMAVACLLLPSAFLVAQSADYVRNSGETVSEQSVSESKAVESEKKLSSAVTEIGAEKSTKKNGALSTFLVFLRMIIVLAIVLAIIWIIFKLLQRTSNGSVDDDKFLRKVASVPVGPGKSVQVVTLVDKAYLIGVADGSVNLISEIDDPELISAMNIYAEKTAPTGKPKNFGEVLEIFMPKKNGKSAGKPRNVFDDGSAQQILDSLKKQSDRMNRGE